MKPGMANENNPTRGTGQRMDNNASASSDAGQRLDVKGSSSFLGLPARDRAAIQQSRNEPFPAEYSTQLEQYLKNLSDQGNRK
jgi:hypothetical protein